MASGFSSFSISESVKNSAIKYINTQEEHHRQLSFNNDLKIFLKNMELNLIPKKKSRLILCRHPAGA